MSALADKILARVLDEDLGLNDFELKNEAARSMSPKEIRELVRHLGNERKLHVGNRDEGGIIRRIDTMTRALGEALEAQKTQRGERAVKVRGKRAARTGKETCTCGKHHPPNANFYVTARDAGRTAYLGGPYATHAEALARVSHMRELAYQNEPRSHHYSFGTAARPSTFTASGLFGK